MSNQMVWLETPTNPLLKLIDIEGAAEVVHQHKVNLLVLGSACFVEFFTRYCLGYF